MKKFMVYYDEGIMKGFIAKTFTPMKKLQGKKLEEAISGMHCPKGFICYKSGLESLCKARSVRSEMFLECLERDTHLCYFSFFSEGSWFCLCPLRIYIAKKLGK